MFGLTSKRLGIALLPLIAIAVFVLSAATQQPEERLHLKGRPASATVPQLAAIPVLSATIVKSYPHDPQAFTQGLEYFEGSLYESTGRRGQSTLRRTALETGKVLKSVSLPPQYFGEGLTIFHDKIYQLTWLDKIGFIYDLNTFRKIGQFPFDTEGWGLAHDDASLILSDGTNRLQYIDPETFKVTRTVEVYAGSEAVTNLNELEYINGEIWANVWHSNRIARIDPRPGPQSGQVVAWIDLTAIAERETHDQEDVLNGIAWDAGRQRLFVTGKDWAKLFEIKVS
jgi:glutamine cyclotransferase